MPFLLSSLCCIKCEHEFPLSLSPSDLFMGHCFLSHVVWGRVLWLRRRRGGLGDAVSMLKDCCFPALSFCFFIIALWRINSQTIPFTYLKFTFQGFLVSSYSFSTLTTILEHLYSHHKNPFPISSHCSLPQRLQPHATLSLHGLC